jgi:hypothetical protein
MGPEYARWDPDRETSVWTFDGRKIEPSATQVPVPWKLKDGDLEEAGRLLDLAGYPQIDGVRGGFGDDFHVQVGGFTEVGGANFSAQFWIHDAWAQLGIPLAEPAENQVGEYFGVVSPRLRAREQVLPVVKNGDVHASNYPIDFPYPAFDTSLTRPDPSNPGSGIGFESPYLSSQIISMSDERDRAVRIEEHLNTADYMLYWQLNNGMFQQARLNVVTDRIDSWIGPEQFFADQPKPEYIVLKR